MTTDLQKEIDTIIARLAYYALHATPTAIDTNTLKRIDELSKVLIFGDNPPPLGVSVAESVGTDEKIS